MNGDHSVPIDVIKDLSDCKARVVNIERENTDQWGKMDKLGTRIDTILNRINIVLGGIAASCVLLALNLMIRLIGK